MAGRRHAGLTFNERLDQVEFLGFTERARIGYPGPNDYAKARDYLRTPLMRTMQLRPVPELVWRTAVKAHDLGDVNVLQDDRLLCRRFGDAGTTRRRRDSMFTRCSAATESKRQRQRQRTATPRMPGLQDRYRRVARHDQRADGHRTGPTDPRATDAEPERHDSVTLLELERRAKALRLAEVPCHLQRFELGLGVVEQRDRRDCRCPRARGDLGRAQLRDGDFVPGSSCARGIHRRGRDSVPAAWRSCPLALARAMAR